ncbi:hypothetical protein ACFQ1S_18650, partial [Kibdelosporangium lantanae]
GLGLGAYLNQGSSFNDMPMVMSAIFLILLVGVGIELIVSARYIDRTTTHWYDEVGVLVHADNDLLPAINRVAVAIGQRRFVVTDVTAGRTRAFAQSD